MTKCALILLAFLSVLSVNTSISSDGAETQIFDIPAGNVEALIDAILDATNNATPAVINLAPGAVYSLQERFDHGDGFNGLPSIRTQITFNGNGAVIERDENAMESFRVFRILSVGELTLDDLKISGGLASGLPGENEEKSGGAIFNKGKVVLNRSTISDNNAPSDGGGIYNLSSLVVSASTISGNVAQGRSTAKGLGGGIYNRGDVEIYDSTISGNSVEELNSSGGGIYNEGSLKIDGSSITGNHTFSFGGGISNSREASVKNTTISGNRAEGAGGSGAGIFNTGGEIKIVNSTISGNSTDGSFSGGGGGIFNDGGTTTIINSTITNNADNDPSSSGGGGFSNVLNGTAFLKSSILAGNTSANQGQDCFTAANTSIVSQGYNIIGDLSEQVEEGTPVCRVTGTVETNIVGEDPMLETLSDNGGKGQTHAIMPDSPAIDHIPAEDCEVDEGVPLESDQRGTIRPLDGNGDGEQVCDAGAFELSLVCGDLDGNGLTEIRDAVLILEHLTSSTLPEFVRLWLGDYDRDGSVTILDAVMALRNVSGASNCSSS